MSNKQGDREAHTTKVRRRLRHALVNQHPVRIHRRWEGSDDVSGFISAIGTTWAAVAQLDEGKRPDGWELLRLSDIRKVRVHGDPPAVEVRVLRSRGQWPLSAPPVALNDIRDLLKSTANCAELLSLHTEKHNPDALWVGALLDVSDRSLHLEAINPEAGWEGEVYSFRLGDITRVTIADAYTASLLEVADPRPSRQRSVPLPIVKQRRGILRRP